MKFVEIIGKMYRGGHFSLRIDAEPPEERRLFVGPAPPRWSLRERRAVGVGRKLVPAPTACRRAVAVEHDVVIDGAAGMSFVKVDVKLGEGLELKSVFGGRTGALICSA